jgi:uncharacterized protein with PQ loop repeat
MIWGWLATFFLTACGVPQMVKSLREGHSNGLSWGFLGLWTAGEICLIVYTILGRDWPILANAIFNLSVMTPIVYMKVYPRVMPWE